MRDIYKVYHINMKQELDCRVRLVPTETGMELLFELGHYNKETDEFKVSFVETDFTEFTTEICFIEQVDKEVLEENRRKRSQNR